MIVVFLSGLLLLTGCTAKTTGSPHGYSALANRNVITLVTFLEPGMVSLHRNPENDRYEMGLLVTPIDGKPQRFLRIAGGLRASEAGVGARIEGEDGRGLVWFHAHKPMAYDYRQHRLLEGRELPRSGGPKDPIRLSDRLEAERFLDPAEKLRPARPRASFIRRGLRSSEPLRDPVQGSNFVVASLSKPGLAGTHVVASIDLEHPEQAPRWTVDTGFFKLEQILPDAETLVLIGSRREDPNKLPEPLAAIVDLRTGRQIVRSLRVQP